jgi:oxygen-dependent protoporphyrinogen oxidase
MSRKRIAVVGAGVTGLSAAWHLQQQDHEVQLYERASTPGGRTASIRQDGFVFDVGAFTLLPTYTQTCRLIEQLGLGDRLHRIKPIIGIPRQRRMHPLHVATPIRSLLSTGLVSLASKLRLLKLFGPLRRAWKLADFRSVAALAQWDGESIASCLQRELNEETLEYIAGPIIRGNMLNSPEGAPFGELLWMLRQYAAPYLYGLDLGINLLAETLASRLTVAYESTVERVERNGSGVMLSGQGVQQGAFSQPYDACIPALPPGPLLELAPELSHAQRHFLTAIKPLPSVSLHLGLRQAPNIRETFILLPRSEQADLTTIVMDHLKAPRTGAGGQRRGLSVLPR